MKTYTALVDTPFPPDIRALADSLLATRPDLMDVILYTKNDFELLGEDINYRFCYYSERDSFRWICNITEKSEIYNEECLCHTQT